MNDPSVAVETLGEAYSIDEDFVLPPIEHRNLVVHQLIESGASVCTQAQVHIHDPNGQKIATVSVKAGQNPLNTVNFLGDFYLHTQGPESDSCCREILNGAEIHKLLEMAQEGGCEVVSELGSSIDEIAAAYDKELVSRSTTCENIRSLNVQELGTDENAKGSFHYVDVDFKIPKEIKDTDDFEREIKRLLPALIEKHPELAKVFASPKDIDQSLLVSARAFFVREQPSLELGRERTYALLTNNAIIVFHDGKSEVIEQLNKSLRNGPQTDSAALFFDLFALSLERNEQIMKDFEDGQVEAVSEELFRNHKLSEETISNTIPRLEWILGYFQRKLDHESTSLAHIIRHLELQTVPALSKHAKESLERAERLSRDVEALSTRVGGALKNLSSAKEANDGLVKLSTDEMIKKLTIVSAIFLPMSLAAVVAAVPEFTLPLRLHDPTVIAKLALVAGGALTSAALLGAAWLRKWR
jgi:Mg2+ and Co2+ transporter CorA